MKLKRLFGLFATATLIVPTVATAADFILTAGHWGKAQNAAVSAAGGTVLWSHKKLGIASVTSDDPQFFARVSGNRHFKSTAEDMMLQWQNPNFSESGSITPDDENLFALQWNMTAIDAPAAWAEGC